MVQSQPSDKIHLWLLVYHYVNFTMLEPINIERKQKSNLVPGMRFDLWEPEVVVIWIHTTNFFSSWRTKHLHAKHENFKTNLNFPMI